MEAVSWHRCRFLHAWIRSAKRVSSSHSRVPSPLLDPKLTFLYSPQEYEFWQQPHTEEFQAIQLHLESCWKGLGTPELLWKAFHAALKMRDFWKVKSQNTGWEPYCHMYNQDFPKGVTEGHKEAYDNKSGIHFVISMQTQSNRLCFHVNVCKHFLLTSLVCGLISQTWSSTDLVSC